MTGSWSLTRLTGSGFSTVCVSGVNSWLSWWCCCVSGYSIIDLLSGCFVMDEMNLGSYCSNIMDEVVL